MTSGIRKFTSIGDEKRERGGQVSPFGSARRNMGSARNRWDRTMQTRMGLGKSKVWGGDGDTSAEGDGVF